VTSVFRRSSRGDRPRDQRDPRGQADLPDGLDVDLQRREQVLAVAQDDHTAAWVVLTTYRVVMLSPAGETQVDRPWHDVDTGAWEPQTMTLSLSWVGSVRGLQWTLRERTGPGRVPEVLRERVSASVVLMRQVDLGPRRTARVSIRKDLSSRQLVDQVLLGRGVRSDDAELARRVAETRRELRDSVGLPPVEGPAADS
jgi:hypothetical protein